MNLRLRVGELVLEGVGERDLPVVLARLEARLAAARPAPAGPAGLRRVELAPITVRHDATPQMVGDALADALLTGPLATPGGSK